MSEAVKGLEPAAVWDYFEQLSAIPRESGNEEAVRSFLISFAREHGLSYESDKAGNLVIRKPPSPGSEHAPAVVLQGHMDMVCVKTESSSHDFTRDPIRLVRRDNWMGADGTTLGADNGIALAMGLALLSDADAVHGPLELLCTTAEEVGLIGALALDSTLVRGRKLINLDSEEEGVFIIGCAGGSEVTGRLKADIAPVPESNPAWKLDLHGFLGGHSGGEIHTGRGNAIRWAMRFLKELALEPSLELRISAIEAGSKRNVIPSSLSCTFTASAGSEEVISASARRFEEAMKAELHRRDPNAAFTLEPCTPPKEAVTAEQTDAVISAVYLVPYGPESWSDDIEGLVETSNNMAVVTLKEGFFFIDTSQRSSIQSAREEIALRTKTAISLCGAETEIINVYPAWTPDLSSPFAAYCGRVYQKFTGKEPIITASHGGLECGVINSKAEGMESISFGPDIYDAHSVDERIDIDSTARTYAFLVTLLEKLSRT